MIEATSGNTGMALAFIGTMKGYRVVICISEIQNVERRKVLKALGAELVLTPQEGGTTAAKAKAIELHNQTPNFFYIGQHSNLDNRRAHGPLATTSHDGDQPRFRTRTRRTRLN